MYLFWNALPCQLVSAEFWFQNKDRVLCAEQKIDTDRQRQTWNTNSSTSSQNFENKELNIWFSLDSLKDFDEHMDIAFETLWK